MSVATQTVRDEIGCLRVGLEALAKLPPLIDHAEEATRAFVEEAQILLEMLVAFSR